MMRRVAAVFVAIALLSSAQAQFFVPVTIPQYASGAAPIGTPTSVGSFNSNAATNVSSCAITTSAAIVSGDLVVVSVEVPSGALQTVSGVSDGTNTYSLAARINDGANFDLEIWYKTNASAVASGSTITATLSGTTSGSNGIACQAAQVSGIPAGTVDKTATQSASTSTPSVTTAALTKSNEIAIGVSYRDTTGTFTQDGNYTTLFNVSTIDSIRGFVGVGYRKLSSSAATTFAPTWSTSSGTQTAIATFQGN